MFPIVVILAQLASAPAPVQKAYQKLTSAEVEAKKLVEPPKDATKIDVSSKIRSASFGHKTWLIVAPGGKEFWIEYGPSTNKPGALFGPFTVEPTAGTTPPSGAEHRPIETPPQSTIPKK
ncbi:MAG TPA: hypothetical protein VN947_16385 [Polyangia bacterium]|nr:hypothetical protein [Polyangia bacterium]